MEQLYFHIGLPKTGSTFLQSIIKNDKRINDQRSSIHKFRPDVQSFKFVKGKSNVVSNETFLLKGEGAGKYNMMKTLSEIKALSADIKIIITLREPYSLLLSMFKYRIKNGAYFKSFDDWFFKDEAQDLFSILHYNVLYQSIQTFFSKNNIFFLFYEDLKNENFMIKEFYEILNLNPKTFPEKALNKSLSSNELIKLNYLNKLLHSKRLKRRLFRYVPLLTTDANFFKSDYAYQIKHHIQKDMELFYNEVSGTTQTKLKKHNYL